MVKICDLTNKIRSKNAGPFWITLDLFCDDAAHYQRLCELLDLAKISAICGVDAGDIQRFCLDDLLVMKIGWPRAHVQGSRSDRDMHGAQMGVLFQEATI